MKYLTLISMLILLSFEGYTQTGEKYKIVTIDSSSLSDYFIIKVYNKMGEKKIFSEKSYAINGTKIRKRKQYNFFLTEIDLLNVLQKNKNDVTLRGPQGLFVDSIEILRADERAYATECLKGIILIPCKESDRNK